jgi:hypothetical protein
MAQTSNDTWTPASGVGGTDDVKRVIGSPQTGPQYIGNHPELFS